MRGFGYTLLAIAAAAVLFAACENTFIRTTARTYAGTTIWRQENTVDAGSNAGADYSFGGDVNNLPNHAVAVDGEWAIIGSTNDGGSSAGAVYLFQHGTSGWIRRARLVASDQANFAGYGTAVAISGNYAVVGAPYADVTGDPGIEGAAYVLKWDGSSWAEIKELKSNSTLNSENFGAAVAIGGDYIAVGDPAYQTNQGKIEFFYKDQLGPEMWGFTGATTAPSPASSDKFGGALAMDGGLLAVGARGRASGRGGALVYTRSGVTWSYTAELTSSKATALSGIGYSVAIVSGFGAAAGAPGTSTVYFFPQEGTTWSTPAALTAAGGSVTDLLGASLALSVDHLIVAAPGYTAAGERGAVYTFLPVSSGWIQRQQFAFTEKAQGSYLATFPGLSVAVSGSALAVGLPFDDTKATDAGAVDFYFYGEANP